MIRHYLKLIWNRKRSNLLIMVEILLSFLVTFAVVTLGIHGADNYRRPLGYAWQDTWNVEVNTRAGILADDAIPPELLETARQVFAAVREFPEVVAAGGAGSAPYGFSEWTASSNIGNWYLKYGVNQVTDGFAEALDLRLTRGRWFDSRDDGAAWLPVVINERLAHEIFGDRDPVGNSVPQERNRDGSFDPEQRIIGVVTDFRQNGEFSPPQNYLFRRHRLNEGEQRPPANLLLRLRPGTTAAFEERLVKRLQAVAPEWSFEVKPLAQMRETRFTLVLAPLIGAGVVAGFLLLMVAMGLTGVLWQTVTQRTREIGLRRAKGATAGDIRAQILGELVVMTSLAVAAGAAIVLQFPLLKLTGLVNNGVYVVSLVVSAACIYLLTIACAWYPSRLATTMTPAAALHYE
ncbi:MAG TPA: FtsX-like permease family protein [Vicinamibacterales bacterium]|nr:FtsX-like permease family protein [Vicinamibacterales bacterium]